MGYKNLTLFYFSSSLFTDSYSTLDVVYKFQTYPNNTDSVVVDENATMAQYTLIRKYQAYSDIKVNDRIGKPGSVHSLQFTRSNLSICICLTPSFWLLCLFVWVFVHSPGKHFKDFIRNAK